MASSIPPTCCAHGFFSLLPLPSPGELKVTALYVLDGAHTGELEVTAQLVLTYPKHGGVSPVARRWIPS